MDNQFDETTRPATINLPAQQAAKAYVANAKDMLTVLWDEIGALPDDRFFQQETLELIISRIGEDKRHRITEIWTAGREGRQDRKDIQMKLFATFLVPTERKNGPPASLPSTSVDVPTMPVIPSQASPPPATVSTQTPMQDATVNAITEDASISFSHQSGTYHAMFALAMSCAIPKAIIYFTIDGSKPSTASHKYPNKKISIDRTVDIVAQACVNGEFVGEPVGAQFTLQVESVDFSTPEGTYNPPLTISLMSKTSGASIFYTLDGSEPNEKSTQNNPKDPLLLTKSTTVKAIAIRSGWNPSSIAVAAYELKSPQWQVLEPTEANDPVLPHDVSEINQLSTNWVVVAASVRGKLHAHRALWRDDSYRYDTVGPWTIITVSDGAGSAKLSRVGSRIICDRAVDRLKVLLDNITLRDDNSQPNDSDLAKISEFLASAARDARTAIAEEANKRSCALGDFAATLLVSLHCVWKDYDFVATIQVGDGAIALLNDDQTAKLAGIADHGQHSSETKFLTTKNIEAEFLHRVTFVMLRGLQSIAVMSDGVSDDFFPEDQRIIELFTGEAIAGMVGIDDNVVNGVAKTIFTTQNPDKVLLEWMKYEKKGSSDDRTLVLAFRR